MPPLAVAHSMSPPSVGGYASASSTSPPSSPDMVTYDGKSKNTRDLMNNLPPRVRRTSSDGRVSDEKDNNGGRSSNSRPPRMRSRTESSNDSLSPSRRRRSGSSGCNRGSKPGLERESSNSSLSSHTSSSSHQHAPVSPPGSSSFEMQPPPDTYHSLQHAIDQTTHLYGTPTSVHVAPLYNRLGNLYFRAANHRMAMECYKQAIRCDPGDHLADAYANLGTVYWTTGQVDQAITVLKQAMATYELDAAAKGGSGDESETGPSPLQVANVLHQLGLAHCLKKEFGAALDFLLKARRIREAQGDHLGVAKTFDAMGKILLCQGNLDAALLHHRQALTILRVSKRASIVNTLINMAQVYMHKNEFREALGVYSELLREQKAHFLHAQSSRQDVKGPAKALHDTLMSAAYCYQRLDCASEASHCLKEASLLVQECGI